jgi:hypothetical protein
MDHVPGGGRLMTREPLSLRLADWLLPKPNLARGGMAQPAARHCPADSDFEPVTPPSRYARPPFRAASKSSVGHQSESGAP